MAKRLMLQEVKNKIANINPNIEVLSDKYNGTSSRGFFKFKICNHKWNTLFMNTLKGIGCPECAKDKRVSKTRLNIDIVKKRLAIINPCIEILSNTYKNNSSKLDCKCRVCDNE